MSEWKDFKQQNRGKSWHPLKIWSLFKIPFLWNQWSVWSCSRHNSKHHIVYLGLSIFYFHLSNNIQDFVLSLLILITLSVISYLSYVQQEENANVICDSFPLAYAQIQIWTATCHDQFPASVRQTKYGRITHWLLCLLLGNWNGLLRTLTLQNLKFALFSW